MDLYKVSFYSVSGGLTTTRFVPCGSPDLVLLKCEDLYPDLMNRGYQTEVEQFIVPGYKMTLLPEEAEGVFITVEEALELFRSMKRGDKKSSLGHMRRYFKQQVKAQLPSDIMEEETDTEVTQ